MIELLSALLYSNHTKNSNGLEKLKMQSKTNFPHCLDNYYTFLTLEIAL